MKHGFAEILAALVLALALGAGAVAESGGTEVPTEEGARTEQAAAQEEAAEAAEKKPSLKKALAAYRAARESRRLEELEAELKEYVEAGELTQEQADLILEHYRGRGSARPGTGPSTRNGSTRSGSRKSAGSNRDSGSSRKSGGSGKGRQRDTSGQPDGTSFGGSAVDMSESIEGI